MIYGNPQCILWTLRHVLWGGTICVARKMSFVKNEVYRENKYANYDI